MISILVLLFLQIGLSDSYVEGDDFDLETLVGDVWDGDFEEVPLLQRNVDSLEADNLDDSEKAVGDKTDDLLKKLDEAETELKEAVGQPPEVIAKFGYGSNDGPVRPGDKPPTTRFIVHPPVHVDSRHDVPDAIKKLLSSEMQQKENMSEEEIKRQKRKADRQKRKKNKLKKKLKDSEQKMEMMGLQQRNEMRKLAKSMQGLPDGHHLFIFKKNADDKEAQSKDKGRKKRRDARKIKKFFKEQKRDKRRAKRKEKRKLRRDERRSKKKTKNMKKLTGKQRRKRRRRRRRQRRKRNRRQRRKDRKAKRHEKRDERQDKRDLEAAQRKKQAIKDKFAKQPKTTKMKLPKAFKKYLKTIDKGKRDQLMSKLKSANKKDKKKFRQLLKQVVKASKEGMKKLEKEESKAAKDLKKDLKKEKLTEDGEILKVSADKDKQIGDIKAKMADLKGEESTNKNKLDYEKKIIKEQGKDINDKLSQEDKKLQEWESKFKKDTDARFKSIQEDNNKLHKLTDNMSEEEKKLVLQLNAVRAQRLVQQKASKPMVRRQRYACHCASDQCKSVCDRCNQCTTSRCDDVCSSGLNYKKQLGALKKQIAKLKKSWDKRSKDNQKALLKLLKKRLGKAKRRYKSKVRPVVKVVKKVKVKGVSKAEKERLRKKATKAKLKANAAKLKGKAKLEKEKLKELQLIFQQWLKRSQRRLGRLLKKQKVKKKNRSRVVRVFKKYINKATATFGKWKSDAKKLAEYLTMTTKVWERRAKKLLKKVRAKKTKKSKKKKKKKSKKKKLPKIPKRSRADMPYGEKLFNEWSDTSNAFLNNHLGAVMPDKRDGVIEFYNQVVEEARKHYLGYLTKDWKIGTKVGRRRDLLKFFKDSSDKLKTHTYIAIFGPGYKTKPGSSNKRRKSRDYIHKMFRKFQKHAKKLAANPKILCKDKVNKELRATLKKGLKERDHAAKTTYKTGPGSDERYVKYLLALNNQFRTKLSYFAKTCVQRKGPRPYVTRMYNMFKRKSDSFVQKQGGRLCKVRYRKRLRDYWKDMKSRANQKYLAFLNREVAQADIKVETEVGEMEVAGGSWQHNAFTRYLYQQSKKLEAFARSLLKKCGFKIVPRKGAETETETTVGKSRSSSRKRDDRSDDDSIYGVTLGMNPNGDGDRSIGIGVESMNDKDAPYSNWQFDDNANWKKNSYEVGVSLGRRRLLELEDRS